MLGFLGITTTLEARLAGFAVILAALAGVVIWIHHAGYEECRAPQVAAQKAQHASDVTADQGAIREDSQNKGELTAPGGVASTPPPALVVRGAGCVPARSAPAAAGPVAPPAESGDRGMLSGAQAEAAVDLGPVVQDLTLAGVLRAANGDELWERDVKESQGAPK